MHRLQFKELPSLQRFDDNYKKGGWGGDTKNPSSGPGSKLNSEPAILWKEELNKVLKKFPNMNVVELGCGDMTLHSSIVWGNRNYTCIEISPTIAKYAKGKYPNKKIIVGDFTKMKIKHGEILVIKEVLQHLSNQEIKNIMDKAIREFKLIVVQNGCMGRITEIGDPTGVCQQTLLNKSPFGYNVVYSNRRHTRREVWGTPSRPLHH